MNDKLFSISKHRDLTSLKDIYNIEVANPLIEKTLRTDLLGSIINEIVGRVSKTILEEQGEKIVNDVLAAQDKVRGQILDKIEGTVQDFVLSISEFRDLFIDKKICNICWETHNDKMRYPIHYFEPMTNLTYLERRHDLIKKWVDSLK